MIEQTDYTPLAGQSHTFPDSVVIRIIQVKQRYDGPYVTYENDYGNSLPRRFVMRADLFMEEYGHLFKLKKES